jgi:parvulin-like peptidyl-prolyl isomerase
MTCSSRASLPPEVIINFLKREAALKDLYQRVLSQQIISETAEKKGITVTEAEIQAEADRQRHQKHLESSKATFSWLAEQFMTPDDWEAGISDRLLAVKLAQSLFSQEVEKYFIEHQFEFERVLLYQFAVPYFQLAQELLYQIEEHEISFYEAAHLYDLDEQRRLRCGYAGNLYRWRFQPDIAALLLGANLGEVIGPVQSEQSYILYRVEEFIPAKLTPETHQIILDRLFNDWLDHELQSF